MFQNVIYEKNKNDLMLHLVNFLIIYLIQRWEVIIKKDIFTQNFQFDLINY